MAGEIETIDSRYTLFLSNLYRLKKQVRTKDLLTHINRLGNAVKIICTAIAKNPEAERQLNQRFADYYLPEAIKLIRTHIEAYSSDKPFSHPTEIIRSIPHAISGIADVAEQQLEALNNTNSIDLSTDLDVLDYMLKMDGVKRWVHSPTKMP